MPAGATPDQAAVSSAVVSRCSRSVRITDTYTRTFFSFTPALDEQLIQQVMSMTDEQINGLDEASRNTILQIVSPRLYISMSFRACSKT